MANGDISDAMVSELGLRLEDAAQTKFTSTFLFKALNNAQLRLAQLLDNYYLTELEKIDSSADISTGSITLTTIASGIATNGVLRGGQGILKTSVDIGAAGTDVWATQIDLKDIKENENTYLAGSDSNPLYYVFADSVYFLVTTYTATIADIYFLKVPDTMTTDVDPELNESLHPLIVDIAEAQSWALDGKFERRAACMDAAMREIEVLNARVMQAEGIGTRQRRRSNG